MAALTLTDLVSGQICPVQRLNAPVRTWGWGETEKGEHYRSEFGAGAGSGGGPCWVCRGSGESRAWVPAYEAIRAEEAQQRKAAEEPPSCLVCYDEGKYGLSTECGHFYCEDCCKYVGRGVPGGRGGGRPQPQPMLGSDQRQSQQRAYRPAAVNYHRCRQFSLSHHRPTSPPPQV